jgi:nitric oxide reductase NorF protein
MARKVAPHLFVSSLWIIIMGIVAALVTSQWHQEALPVVALIVVLCLTVLKARLIILDFMSLRGSRPVLATALLAWPMLFTSAVAIKAAAGL